VPGPIERKGISEDKKHEIWREKKRCIIKLKEKSFQTPPRKKGGGKSCGKKNKKQKEPLKPFPTAGLVDDQGKRETEGGIFHERKVSEKRGRMRKRCLQLQEKSCHLTERKKRCLEEGGFGGGGGSFFKGFPVLGEIEGGPMGEKV